MLIHLLPEQVSAAWDAVAPSIAEGLPPAQQASHQTMVGILQAILEDRVAVWAYLSEDEVPMTKAIITTAEYRDPVLHTPSLLIYSFTALESLTVEQWKDGFETLRQYAVGMGVESIIAYTANKAVIQMATSRLGASAEYVLLEF